MWALALVDPKVYATPYIFALIICILVFSGLLFKFKFLRSFQRKSLAIYVVTILVVVFLSFQAYDTGLGPTHIGYDFTVNTQAFQPDVVNQFNVTSGTNGIRPTSYYLVLTSVNASFTEENPKEYLRVDNITIKIPFKFEESKPANLNKLVFFKIDQNATGCSIGSGIEAAADSKIVVTTWIGTLQCSYNTKLNSYTVEEIFRTSV